MSAAVDGAVKLWQVETGACTTTLGSYNNHNSHNSNIPIHAIGLLSDSDPVLATNPNSSGSGVGDGQCFISAGGELPAADNEAGGERSGWSGGIKMCPRGQLCLWDARAGMYIYMYWCVNTLV